MEPLHKHYEVDGDDFTRAGEASSDMKRVMRKLGVNPEHIRKASVCMYEGEINMVIHASGGTADVSFDGSRIIITLQDIGPGIADITKAMQEGYSTASEQARDLGFGAGMGLPNMKKYADEFDISTEIGVGTRVVMTINVT